MGKLTEQQIENAKQAWREAYQKSRGETWFETSEDILAAIAPHVQYAPTAPGAPLSDEEKRGISPVLPVGYMGSWISALWMKIDAVLAKRTTAPLFVTLTKSDWEAISDAVDTLNKWSQGRYKDEAGNSPTWNATCALLRDLRDKCNIVASVTPEERVTVKYVDGLGETGIFLDNKLQKSFTQDVDVSRYAAGLIAELAKETIREEN